VLISVLVVAAALPFGLIATAAERSRAHAAQAVRTEAEPLLVQSATLYTALADASATATTTFLKGGLELPARRARYVRDLRQASDALATLTRDVGNSADAGAPLGAISEQLPVYSGLVEAARANNRQGLPVGAAYLRQASTLLTGSILPEADQLYSTEANHLRDDYGTGTAAAPLAILALMVIASLVLLVLTQLYLARISRRILNVPMLLATIVLAVMSIWAIVGLIAEQNALGTARRQSDAVEVLSATRVLVSRAQSDQSLTLVNRGSDEIDPRDFSAVIRALEPPNGLLGEVVALARPTAAGAAANQLVAEFASYRATSGQVATLEGNGRVRDAIGRASSATAVTDRLNANLAREIATAQARFTSGAADATTSVAGLSIAIPVLTLFTAALALMGLRQRLGDYR
jgi:hypothetical protein